MNQILTLAPGCITLHTVFMGLTVHARITRLTAVQVALFLFISVIKQIF